MNPWIKACGIINGLCWLANGVLRGIIDAYTGETSGIGANPWLLPILLGLNIIRNGFADPAIDSATPGPTDWSAWGTGLLSSVEALFLFFLTRGCAGCSSNRSPYSGRP